MITLKSLVPKVFYTQSLANMWNDLLLPAGLPLLLGLILGPILAVLIVQGNWVFVLPLALLIPAVIFIIEYPFAAIMIWLIVLPFFPFVGEYKYLYYALHRVLVPFVFGLAILYRPLKLANPRFMRFVWI